MSDLVQKTREVIQINRQYTSSLTPEEEYSNLSLEARISIANESFVETLLYREVEEIEDVIDKLYGELLDLPIFMRHLAFRLACLLQPQNAEIRRRTARDLQLWGPEWDEIVARLQREANAIERAQGSGHRGLSNLGQK